MQTTMRRGLFVTLGLLAGLAVGVLLHQVPATGAPTSGAAPLEPASPVADAPRIAPLPEVDAAAALPLDEHASSGSEADPAGRSQGLDLTLVHVDGAPAAGATVLLARADVLLAAGRTDDLGRVRLTPAQDLAPRLTPSPELIVGGVCDVPERLPLESTDAQQRIVLGKGLRVEGHILLDGAAPTEPLLLALQALPRKRERDVPEGPVSQALYVSIAGQATGSTFNAQVVGAGGHFEFSGLPPGWNGRFVLHRSLVPEGGANALRVQAPATGVELRLSRSSTIHGRVVEPGGGVAVPFAAIAFQQHRPRGDASSSFVSGADGRFEIPLDAADDLQSLDLRIAHPGGSAFRELQWTGEELRVRADRGDIELVPTRATLHFRAIERDGAAVAGAIARAEDMLGARSAPTDAQGLGELRGVPPETALVTVWAQRHGVARVDLSAVQTDTSPGDPLVVVLDRCPSLDVLLQRGAGVVAVDLLVVVESDGPMFSAPSRVHGTVAQEAFAPDDMAFEVGTSPLARSAFTSQGVDAQPSHGSASFRPDASGRVSLSMIVPQRPFDLSVQDVGGSVVWGPETLQLAPEEGRTVQVLIDHDPRDLLVHVTDLAGQPLEFAYVDVLHDGHAGSTQGATRADGTVTLSRLYSDSVSLAVDCEGYVTETLDRVVVAVGRVDVRLAPGRTVHVRVRDGAGRPALATTVRARRDGHAVGRAGPVACADGDESAQLGACWSCSDLPSGTLSFEALVCGQAFVATASGELSDVDILVPAVGTLVARLDLPREDAALRLEVAGVKGIAIEHALEIPEWARGESRIAGLLPGSYRISLVQPSTGVALAGPQVVEVSAEVDTVVVLSAAH
ncbi:MAG TPA: hypothetical protein VFY71_09970 [Planctomycetota bacterium]|nr:hypothetical protein [Planctomycetota bacterium]